MKGSVLVVGAGPAGMRATSELVNQGFKVILVEEKPTIGGKMAQIDRMFPSNECSTCTILPKMLELTSNPNVTIVSFADVESIEGEPGDFKVKVTKKPRYVDPAKCTLKPFRNRSRTLNVHLLSSSSREQTTCIPFSMLLVMWRQAAQVFGLPQKNLF